LSTPVSHQTTNHVPESVARIADLMSTFREQWALCGGWAVDAWLGRESREHVDTDIVIFQDGHRAFFDHMAGWQMVAHDMQVDGGTAEPWNGRPLTLPAHIHARYPVTGEQLPDRVDNAGGQGFGLDVQLNEREGGDWVLRRKPLIALPLSRCVQPSGWGLPTLVPEVLLFYKAKRPRAHDELDFAALLPHLAGEQRSWLHDTISLLKPSHPWLAQLS
jgi:hypothetical protein